MFPDGMVWIVRAQMFADDVSGYPGQKRRGNTLGKAWRNNANFWVEPTTLAGFREKQGRNMTDLHSQAYITGEAPAFRLKHLLPVPVAVSLSFCCMSVRVPIPIAVTVCVPTTAVTVAIPVTTGMSMRCRRRAGLTTTRGLNLGR